MKFLPFALCLCSLISQVTPARILALFFSGSASHKIAFDPLLIDLAKTRGHQVTVFTSYKTIKEPIPNLHEIYAPSVYEIIANLSEQGKPPNMIEMRLKGENMMNPSLITKLPQICDVAYALPQLNSLLNETFDLVMMDAIMGEGFFALMDHFNTPKILLSSMPTPYWVASSLGTPTLPSFVPAMFARFTENMDLWDRLRNTALHFLFDGLLNLYLVPKWEEIAKRKFPHARGSRDILRDVNLVLENYHVSLNVKRPVTPDIIDVGGLHCREPQPLPNDLQEFADGAGPAGFILFSLGSIGQESQMPEQLRKMFVNAFSKLKVKVLWKWADVTMEEELPPNIKLSSWLPQQDVLGHPNCKLFLTHGGLLSMQESVYHTIPMLGLPVFGDQDTNMQTATEQGFALWLELRTLNEEQLISTITRMLEDNKFKETVQNYSALYKDNLVNPLEKSVFWVEYILRHNGAPHLKSAGRDLKFIQFYSLDSMGILLASLFAVFYVIYLALKLSLCKLTSTLLWSLGFRSKKSKSD